MTQPIEHDAEEMLALLQEAEDPKAAPVRLMTGRTPKGRRIRLTTEAELEALQPPEYLVEGVIPEGGLGLIYGASETFKSFMMLYLALCVAGGLDFRGLKVRRGAVLYVAAEGFFGLVKRYRAFMAYHGLTDPLGAVHFLRHGVEVREGSTDLRELLDAIGEQVGGPLALIVLDTLNRNFTGNENAAEDMTAYIRGCDKLREVTGAAVISVHHTGHVELERGRGHSSLRGALDVEIKCARDGDRVTLECTKMKDDPHFAPLTFDMVPAGESLVPKGVGTADVKMTPSRATALEVLPTEGGLTRDQWKRQSDIPAGTFRHARDWHIAMGYARQTREAKYVRTESGTLALCQLCQGGASVVPSNHGAVRAKGGGI